MPLPTQGMMHQNRPLETFTVAVMQEDANFILWQATEGAVEEVDHKSDDYYVYNDGDWNRLEMQPRGPSEESHGSGWRLSTESYKCDRFAVHKDWDMSDVANADAPVDDTDEQAELYLGNQGRMYGDFLMAAEVFAPAIWTDDLDGTTGAAVTGTSFVQWDDASGDPQKDIVEYNERVAGRIGFKCNVMLVGAVTHSKLITNAVVRDAIKYTQHGTVQAVEDSLATYFGVDKYFVCRSFRNTANELATKTYEYICDSKAAWIGYVAPMSGKYQMSAYKMFAYKHNGAATKGVIVRSMELPWRTSMRHEIETFWDVKVTAADAACFFDAAVS